MRTPRIGIALHRNRLYIPLFLLAAAVVFVAPARSQDDSGVAGPADAVEIKLRRQLSVLDSRRSGLGERHPHRALLDKQIRAIEVELGRDDAQASGDVDDDNQRRDGRGSPDGNRADALTGAEATALIGALADRIERLEARVRRLEVAAVDSAR